MTSDLPLPFRKRLYLEAPWLMTVRGGVCNKPMVSLSICLQTRRPPKWRRERCMLPSTSRDRSQHNDRREMDEGGKSTYGYFSRLWLLNWLFVRENNYVAWIQIQIRSECRWEASIISNSNRHLSTRDMPPPNLSPFPRMFLRKIISI